MLKNPFYVGQFEFPVNSGIWYKGGQPKLVTKEVFDKVQLKLVVPPKSAWGSRNITFRGIFKCASCGGTVTGEEKFRKRLHGDPKRHVYYHCGKSKDPNCIEPFLSEEELIKSLVNFINFMSLNHTYIFTLNNTILEKIENFKEIRQQALLEQNLNSNIQNLPIKDYAKHILKNGTNEEKIEITQIFNKQLYIHNKNVCSAPIKAL